MIRGTTARSVSVVALCASVTKRNSPAKNHTILKLVYRIRHYFIHQLSTFSATTDSLRQAKRKSIEEVKPIGELKMNQAKYDTTSAGHASSTNKSFEADRASRLVELCSLYKAAFASAGMHLDDAVICQIAMAQDKDSWKHHNSHQGRDSTQDGDNVTGQSATRAGVESEPMPSLRYFDNLWRLHQLGKLRDTAYATLADHFFWSLVYYTALNAIFWFHYLFQSDLLQTIETVTTSLTMQCIADPFLASLMNIWTTLVHRAQLLFFGQSMLYYTTAELLFGGILSPCLLAQATASALKVGIVKLTFRMTRNWPPNVRMVLYMVGAVAFCRFSWACVVLIALLHCVFMVDISIKCRQFALRHLTTEPWSVKWMEAKERFDDAVGICGILALLVVTVLSSATLEK
jgi:hypothetical protein